MEEQRIGHPTTPLEFERALSKLQEGTGVDPEWLFFEPSDLLLTAEATKEETDLRINKIIYMGSYLLSKKIAKSRISSDQNRVNVARTLFQAGFWTGTDEIEKERITAYYLDPAGQLKSRLADNGKINTRGYIISVIDQLIFQRDNRLRKELAPAVLVVMAEEIGKVLWYDSRLRFSGMTMGNEGQTTFPLTQKQKVILYQCLTKLAGGDIDRDFESEPVAYYFPEAYRQLLDTMDSGLLSPETQMAVQEGRDTGRIEVSLVTRSLDFIRNSPISAAFASKVISRKILQGLNSIDFQPRCAWERPEEFYCLPTEEVERCGNAFAFVPDSEAYSRMITEIDKALKRMEIERERAARLKLEKPHERTTIGVGGRAAWPLKRKGLVHGIRRRRRK